MGWQAEGWTRPRFAARLKEKRNEHYGTGRHRPDGVLLRWLQLLLSTPNQQEHAAAFGLGCGVPFAAVMFGVSPGRSTEVARRATQPIRLGAGLVLVIAGFWMLYSIT